MNRQALTEALGDWNPDGPSKWQTKVTIVNAARLVERLLPDLVDDSECMDCDHPPRQVWDEGTVEAVARAIYEAQRDDKLAGGSFQGGDWVRTMSQTPRHKETYRRQARTVLSALVELLTEKVET